MRSRTNHVVRRNSHVRNTSCGDYSAARDNPGRLQAGRVCLGRLPVVPERRALQRFDRTGLVEVNDDVELVRQPRRTVMALGASTGRRSIRPVAPSAWHAHRPDGSCAPRRRASPAACCLREMRAARRWFRPYADPGRSTTPLSPEHRRGVFGPLPGQLDQLRHHLALARRPQAEPGRVPVVLQFVSESIEATVAASRSSRRRRIYLVEIREDGRVGMRREPADEVEHVRVSPHPRGESSEVAPLLAGIFVAADSAREAVDPIDIGPVIFDGNRIESALLNQPPCDERTLPVVPHARLSGCSRTRVRADGSLQPAGSGLRRCDTQSETHRKFARSTKSSV